MNKWLPKINYMRKFLSSPSGEYILVCHMDPFLTLGQWFSSLNFFAQVKKQF